MSVCASIAVALVIFRLKAEERRGRLEQFYSGAVSRVYTLAGFVLIATVLAFVLQMATAIGMWSAALVVMEDPVSLESLLKTALNYLPAVLFIVGLAAFLVGVLPRATSFVWFLLVYTFFAVYLGSMLNMPEWTQELSPFSFLPRYPVEDFAPAPAIILCVAAVVLFAAGLVGYRRRNLG
jgi:ABC-2 type transport system permease protein